jgi:hypothetical protein
MVRFAGSFCDSPKLSRAHRAVMFMVPASIVSVPLDDRPSFLKSCHISLQHGFPVSGFPSSHALTIVFSKRSDGCSYCCLSIS